MPWKNRLNFAVSGVDLLSPSFVRLFGQGTGAILSDPVDPGRTGRPFLHRWSQQTADLPSEIE
jgi:hypothetical protein